MIEINIIKNSNSFRIFFIYGIILIGGKMTKIKVMDELLANKIAAGEVVERCASVVKELVENSIDAKSTEIKIELIDAGTKEIKVIDNGIGMEKDDAVLAFGRHATSKIIDEDDLYHINTLGFRGEALASIASVSKITLKTSTGSIGTIVEIEGGRILETKKGDARKGTSIIVKDLFYNTPARLKYLKSLYTELASITDYINKLALSHPDIKFTLINNESVLLKTDGSNDLLKTINAIFGLEVTKKMKLIQGENSDYIVSGYILLPEINRSSRNNMITLVNGRVVKNQELTRAINDAYHSYKPDNRYPIVVINIEVDPSQIDVNIHPTKMDIKFSKIEELIDLITKLIKKAITGINLIPEVKIETPNYEPITLDLERKVNDFEEVYEPIQVNNFEEEPINAKEESLETLPELYPVGLVHGTYIICQNDEGMYLMDQHAAKERINYEKYLYMLGHPNNNQIDMLFPLTIELPNNEFIILKENMHLLTDMNFKVEEFGINSVVVKSHPIWLPNGNEEEAIHKIIDLVATIEKNFSIEKFNESLAMMMSCKLAIKANMNITLEEMENLINDLRKCKNPYNCPHGRPTIIFYSNYDLEKLFKRSGF